MRYPTMIEGKNYTIFSLIPRCCEVLIDYMHVNGIPYLANHVNAHDYQRIVRKYPMHNHIVVITDPVTLHKTGSYYMQKTDWDTRWREDFYSYYLTPWLGHFEDRNLFTYIEYEELHEYIGKFSPYEPKEGPQLFDLMPEIQEYALTLKIGTKLTVGDWNDYILRKNLL